jgi:hypothetical protein
MSTHLSMLFGLRFKRCPLPTKCAQSCFLSPRARRVHSGPRPPRPSKVGHSHYMQPPPENATSTVMLGGAWRRTRAGNQPSRSDATRTRNGIERSQSTRLTRPFCSPLVCEWCAVDRQSSPSFFVSRARLPPRTVAPPAPLAQSSSSSLRSRARRMLSLLLRVAGIGDGLFVIFFFIALSVVICAVGLRTEQPG